MTADERRNALRRVIDQVYNKGNVDALDELYAPHCSFHDPSNPVEGVAGTKQFVRELRAAQPDFHCDVHDILVDGDMTAGRWTMGATDRNEFRGMPPTGKTYVVTGTTFNKWEGDRIVEEWDLYDSLGMLQQLGHVPETAQLMQGS